MTSAVGAGAVLMGLVLARGAAWLTLKTLKMTLLLSSIVIIVFALSTDFTLSLVAVCLLGFLLSLCGVGSQILIQTLVDDELRGRVSSFWGMIAFGGTSLGSLLVGAAAHSFGLQPAVTATGLLCVALNGLNLLRRRAGRSATPS